MSPRKKLLIVEDEKAILQGLEDLFVFNGYEVESRMDGKEGLDAALNNRYDCILLDVMLPSMDGFSVCNEIRKHSREQPIVMLTAKNSEEDIINGLSLGADDYISKPFSIRELVLRIETILRRSGHDRSQQELTITDNLVINMETLSGEREGKTLLFTRRELDILQFLSHNHHRPVSRKELLSEVWGYNKTSDVDTRTVDIHIAKLRKKIEIEAKRPKYLITVRGEGYQLLST
jgi:two-component system response regulator RegX3